MRGNITVFVDIIKKPDIKIKYFLCVIFLQNIGNIKLMTIFAKFFVVVAICAINGK